MEPKEFKIKWQLTYVQLADALGYSSDYTVRSWFMQSKHKRNPHPSIHILCKLLDEKWSATNNPRSIPTIQ